MGHGLYLGTTGNIDIKMKAECRVETNHGQVKYNPAAVKRARKRGGSQATCFGQSV